jgi:hypothetical protein
MSQDNLARTPGADWSAIVGKSGTPEFAAAFTSNPVLEASVLHRALVGTDAIDAFFVVTSRGIYDSFRFTTETVSGRKTYLEWEGSAFGRDVGGATVLTRDGTGLIESIRLYHRPLQMVLEVSKELAKRLKGKVNPRLLDPPDRAIRPEADMLAAKDSHEAAPNQFVESGSIRFAYRRFGRRGGTPLLLLGYFTANLDRWDPKVTNGLAAEREVILLDYPGIGGSSRRDAIDRRGTDQGLRRILPHAQSDTV